MCRKRILSLIHMGLPRSFELDADRTLHRLDRRMDLAHPQVCHLDGKLREQGCEHALGQGFKEVARSTGADLDQPLRDLGIVNRVAQIVSDRSLTGLVDVTLQLDIHRDRLRDAALLVGDAAGGLELQPFDDNPCGHGGHS